MFNNKNKNIFSGMEIEDYVLTATESEAAKMEKPFQKKWLEYFWFIVLFFIILLFVRIIFLNVIKGSYYNEMAKGNSVRSVVIKAPRGRIFDRKGVALANNMPSIDAVIIPANIPNEDSEIDKIVDLISSILKIDKIETFQKIKNITSNSKTAILLKENISQDESLIILEKENELKCIEIEKTAIRQYADGLIFSHILGYEGKIEQKELEQNKDNGYLMTDYIGKQGIEKSYEKYLRGENGANQLEVNAIGNTKRSVGIINPKAGNDLILSIDADLQKKIYDSIGNILQKTKTHTASAVAINPKNGEILAMVNIPSFDNNLFAKKISNDDYANLINDPNKPLFNRSIAGEYPPGSTIKPAISTAALSEGVINQDTIISGLGGVLNIGKYSFRDWKTHSPSNVKKAIAESNDIFFYTVGGGYGEISGLGMDRMKKWYNLFGLGELAGIDIGGEKTGLIPDEKWKFDKLNEKWSIGNSYHAAIGQGFVTATPLQIANYITAIANGGTLYKPHFVSKIKKSDGKVENIESEIIRSNFVSKDILQIVKEGMRETVLSGTAQPLKELPVAIGAKTGTAQFGTGEHLQEHGWLVTFAPYENPEIAMVVLVEGAGEGFTSALPVTKEVYEWYFGDKNK